MKLRSLSIFFPAYNDSLSIPSLVRDAHNVAKKLTNTFEIVVINDGSADNTQEVLEALQKRYKKLRVITHSQNKGYGAALIRGFSEARYEWVFYTDGDGQYDVKELVKLVSRINKDIDVINGFKIKRSDSFLRILVGNTYKFLSKVLYSLPISDIDCDFRLIRGSKLKKISLVSSSGTICLELMLKLKNHGALFTEVGVHHYPRKYGRSQFLRPKHLVNTFIEYVRFYFDAQRLSNKK